MLTFFDDLLFFLESDDMTRLQSIQSPLNSGQLTVIHFAELS